MHRRLYVSAAILFGALVGAAPVFGWNGFGHRAVARIACLEITDGQQRAVFDLLKNHPHFVAIKDFPKIGDSTEFFKQRQPAGVSDVEWAILQSGTWPDFVRTPRFSKLSKEKIAAHPVYKYHRKFDHFFDMPLVDPSFKLPVKLDNPGTLLEALAKAEADLKDPKVSAEAKAIAFCWLAHLVGDIHQPLHCTSYFSKDYPKGDAGGNLFLIGKTNLHSFWDDVLGTDKSSFAHFDAIVHGIHRAPQLQKNKMHEFKKNETYKSWADESHGIAASFAYKDGKKALKGGHASTERDDVPIAIPDFPAHYKADARSIAERRVALAGYRLAAKIDAIFPK